MKGAAFDLPKGPQHGEMSASVTPTAVKSRSVEQYRREDSGGVA
jgi:hypothetical protein